MRSADTRSVLMATLADVLDTLFRVEKEFISATEPDGKSSVVEVFISYAARRAQKATRRAIEGVYAARHEIGQMNVALRESRVLDTEHEEVKDACETGPSEAAEDEADTACGNDPGHDAHGV